MNVARKFAAPAEFKLDESGAVSVAFAQFGVVDKDGDLTLPGAFGRKEVPLGAYGHTSWDGALPTGRGIITEQGDWAVLDGQFFLDTSAGADTYHTVKAMAGLQEWSYGYRVVDSAFEIRDGETIRILKAVDAFEVSPVLVGAGIGTHTRAIKGAGSALGLVDNLDWVTGELSAAIDRAGLRAEFRAKEGRVLSSANRDRLAALAEAWRTGLAELEALLSETEPKDAQELRRLRARALRELSRLNGVDIPE